MNLIVRYGSAKHVSDNSLLSILEFLEKGTGIEVHTSILAQSQILLDYEPKMQDWGVLPLSPLGWIISDIQCSALSNVSFCSIRILIMNYWACKLIYVSIIFIAFCVGLSDNKPTKYLISIETGVPGRWVIFEWVHCPPVRRQFHWYLLPAPTKCKYWLISINRTKKYVSKLISIFVFILITSFTVLVKLLRNKLDFSHTF